jgi:hypothetical protein
MWLAAATLAEQAAPGVRGAGTRTTGRALRHAATASKEERRGRRARGRGMHQEQEADESEAPRPRTRA